MTIRPLAVVVMTMCALTGVLAGEAAAASAPDTDARLMVWVKAEDLADRHESGARIAVWPDASGNGHDLKATGDNRPALKLLTDIDEQEDRWAVGFSGTGSFFSMPLAGEWRGVTIFAAGKSLAKPGLFETAPARDGSLRHYGFVQSCGNKTGIGWAVTPRGSRVKSPSFSSIKGAFRTTRFRPSSAT